MRSVSFWKPRAASRPRIGSFGGWQSTAENAALAYRERTEASESLGAQVLLSLERRVQPTGPHSLPIRGLITRSRTMFTLSHLRRRRANAPETWFEACARAP